MPVELVPNMQATCSLLSLSTKSEPVRSGMGAYAGAARRRVHLATVLVRPPSGHRLGRSQARKLDPDGPS